VLETRQLGDLTVSCIGLGCMGMTPFYSTPDPGAAARTLHKAAEIGVTLIDTSDFYGHGENERRVGAAIRPMRERFVLASKFGNLRLPDGTPAVCGRPDYVAQACRASLERLGVDSIDLYYIHRIDPTVPIEDTVGAMARLVEQGLIRAIGLSEASATTLRRAHATYKVTALQTEYSLWTRDVEGGILDACRELGIGFVGYAPLGRGFLTGRVTQESDLEPNDIRRKMPRFQGDNMRRNLDLVATLRAQAEAMGCTAAQLAIAWVLSRGNDIVPLVGTTSPERLVENAKTASLRIPAATLAALEAAFPPDIASGVRTVPSLLPRLGI
jgi:aryl-alcohol dehydrogenase-like predicted oxidoreductase